MIGEKSEYFLVRVDLFDEEGYYKPNGKFLLELIKEWELEFYKLHAPFKANHIFATQNSLNLLRRCLDDDYDFGMDPNLDLDSNLELEIYMPRPRIYALGSELPGNEEEPLFLMVVENASEGAFRLVYIPEDDGDEEIEAPPPEIPERERIIA